MRKLLFVIGGALLLINTNAFAKRPYGAAGCGLGSSLMGSTGNQSSAATTNSFAYNQLFAITSGTSNCMTADEWAKVQDQEQFFFANLSTLSKEMAQGSGDSVAVLSEKLGCSSDVQAQVAANWQTSYGQIFKQPGAMAQLNAAKGVISADENLAQNCSYLF